MWNPSFIRNAIIAHDAKRQAQTELVRGHSSSSHLDLSYLFLYAEGRFLG
jgi:hypothetical protein